MLEVMDNLTKKERGTHTPINTHTGISTQPFTGQARVYTHPEIVYAHMF